MSLMCEVCTCTLNQEGTCTNCETTTQESQDFKDGVAYALEYLSDLFEGIETTDLWAEYMDEGESK